MNEVIELTIEELDQVGGANSGPDVWLVNDSIRPPIEMNPNLTGGH